jgi:DNA end-binding protein Ku
MRKKEYVGALKPENGYLTLITLRFADEIVPASELELPEGRKPDAREIRMAEQLVEALTDKFVPTEFKDEYRGRVLEYVERKARGEKIRLHRPKEHKPTSKSLADVLKASLRAVGKEKKSA